MTFSDLGLGEETLKAVAEAGYTDPTPIQEQAIPKILAGSDVLGIAQTGTGKTAGFTLPMIEILGAGRAKARMPRSLILEPTRELAAQVAQSFETYGKYHRLNMALLIGGVSFDDQDRKLDRGVDVLIATPGRLLDHFQRGKLMLNGVQVLVVDEADRMLDMGFIPDVERICKLIPGKRQTLFFSATMPSEIQRLADQFLVMPTVIEVASRTSTAATVSQALCVVDEIDKRNALRHFLRTEEISNAIIFCNRKRDVDILVKSLKKHGFDAEGLHGDLSQSHRMDVLERYRNGDIKILVASDVAARGLDIPDVSHVFNFDVPQQAEDYIHRIGRTGRAGRTGHSIMFAAPEDGPNVQAIQKLIDKKIEIVTVPDVEALELDFDEKSTRRRRRTSKAKPAPRSSSAKSRTDRSSQKTEKSETAPEKPAKKTQPKTQRKREKKETKTDDKDVVGLGDHVPAFLMRKPR
ncbi:MAG TPA: DEAD/DEAH box helicase [Alphaproteobacteria bacterium]|nr:DEAD/DEAH box helicase [Alphaproteobacteria bacterium]